MTQTREHGDEIFVVINHGVGSYPAESTEVVLKNICQVDMFILFFLFLQIVE